MVQFRPQAREIIAKVVYYGPPLGGKTTNLRSLYQGYPPEIRGELVTVPTGGDRTIFFDFLPISAGDLRGQKLRVQLYTVPGQVHYNSTRQIVLRGVDGVVFVADSQRELVRNNREAWENLKENLALQGLSLATTPHVLQYNKRDLTDILSLDDLDQLLNEFNAPFFDAVASVGIGVEETLQGIVRLVVRSLRERFRGHLDQVAAGRAPDLPEVPGQPGVFASSDAVPVATPSSADDVPAAVFASAAAASGEQSTHKITVDRAAVSAASEAEAVAEAFELEPAPGSDGETVPPGALAELQIEAAAEAPSIAFDELELASPLGADHDPNAITVQVGGTEEDVVEPAFEEPGFEPAFEAPQPSPVRPGVSALSSALGEPGFETEFGGPADTVRISFDPSHPPSRPVAAPPAAFDPPPAAEPEPVIDELSPFDGAVESFAFAEPAAEPEPIVEAAAPPPEPEPAPFESEPWEVEQPPAPPPPAADADPFADPFAFDTAAEPQATAQAPDDVFVFAEPQPAAPPAFEPAADESARAEPVATEPAFDAGLAFEESPQPATEEATVSAETAAELAGWAEPELEELAFDEPTPEEQERPAPEAEQPPPAAIPPGEAAALVQRVVPRAIAQYGEVRELELEVPVPSPWVGGRRMTLQLRLTLVPQEEDEDAR